MSDGVTDHPEPFRTLSDPISESHSECQKTQVNGKELEAQNLNFGLYNQKFYKKTIGVLFGSILALSGLIE